MKRGFLVAILILFGCIVGGTQTLLDVGAQTDLNGVYPEISVLSNILNGNALLKSGVIFKDSLIFSVGLQGKKDIVPSMFAIGAGIGANFDIIQLKAHMNIQASLYCMISESFAVEIYCKKPLGNEEILFGVGLCF